MNVYDNSRVTMFVFSFSVDFNKEYDVFIISSEILVLKSFHQENSFIDTNLVMNQKDFCCCINWSC
jgi:hypothetical protein